MKCFIDGREIDAGSIGPPAMNFGQHCQYEGCSAYRYRYLLTVEEFLQRLGQWFEKFRREEIALKDVEDNDGFPQLERYRQLGFPPLSVLVDEHPGLLLDLAQWNDQQVLDQLSERPKQSPIYYSTNSLDALSIKLEMVEIEGVAYSIRSKV